MRMRLIKSKIENLIIFFFFFRKTLVPAANTAPRRVKKKKKAANKKAGIRYASCIGRIRTAVLSNWLLFVIRNSY